MDSVEIWFKFNRFSYFVSRFLGGPLCFTLLFLILRTKAGILQNYQIMLFVCCLGDTLCWLSSTLLQLQSNIVDDVLLIVPEGPVGLLHGNTQTYFVALYCFTLNIVVATLPANFYSRYDIVKNYRPSSRCKIASLYLVPCIFAFILSAWCKLVVRETRMEANNPDLWIDILGSTKLLMVDTKTTFTRGFLIYVFVFTGICYGICIYFGVKTVTAIKESSGTYNSKAMIMQRQISTVLLIQAITPLFTSVGPATLSAASVLLEMASIAANNTTYGFIAWIPVINPLATMIIIKPFRRKLLNFVGGGKSISTSTAVRPMGHETR